MSATDILSKAQNIRLLIMDVDGVLTDGRIYFSHEGDALKSFHCLDGQGIKLLHQAQIETAVISARNSQAVKLRLKELGVKHVFMGQANKRQAYQSLKQELDLQDNQVAYIGDDLPDLCVMLQVGLRMTVQNAANIVKEHAHWISAYQGGKGAVREACEFILTAQNKLTDIIAPYLEYE